MKAGFLDNEAPCAPISASELEEKFTVAQAEAQRLRGIEDPEETPFTSRYEERSVLSDLAKQAAANETAEPEGSDAARRARTIKALAEGQLGRNFIDTEEPGSAQPKLESAIAGLEGVDEHAVAHIEALNNLGVVWCNRGEVETALDLLERAREAHTAVSAKQAAELDEGARLRLEDARTLSTFYLAQAYGGLGRRAEAASHCHETMRRQLERRNASESADAAARAAALAAGGAGAELAYGSENRSEFSFDPDEWARNACDLSKYYTTVHRLDIAEHCLHAAESVLSTARKAEAAKKATAAKKAAEVAAAFAAVDVSEGGGGEGGESVEGGGEGGDAKPVRRIFLNGTAEDKEESERLGRAQQQASLNAAEAGMSEDEAEKAALVDLAWARLWLASLKRAAELKVSKAEGGESSEEGQEGEALGPLSALSFPTLRLPAASVRLSALGEHAGSFDGARELFKLGSARAARAKATLVLDGFVTLHFEVLEVEVELYAQLAMWEPDLARKHAMHKRRFALIEPAVMQLSEKAYTQLVRQGLFDCSTICSEMLELKCAMHEGEPAPRKLKKIEPAVQAAIDACNAFISRFETDGEMPQRVDESQERAYVQCRFHRARAHGKLETVPALGTALKEYEQLVTYLGRNAVDGMEQELGICKEMVELLPHKIRNAQRLAALRAA